MQKTLRTLLLLTMSFALCLSLLNFSIPAMAEDGTPTLDKTELTMLLGGGIEHLDVLNAPTGVSIIWTSDDWRVARVSNGYVISVGEGTANITATVNGTDLKCMVKVYNDDKLITNDVFTLDTDGNPIFAQSGSIYKFGDKYYWYGVNFDSSASYYKSMKSGKGTTGSSIWSTIRCYSSTNLVDWKFEGDIAANGKNGWPGGWTWVARLGVAYNAKNNNYVLLSQQGSGAGKGSAVLFATSPTPTGPWKYLGYQKNLNTLGPDPCFSAGNGDMTVFYDYTTGKAYLIFDCDGITDGIHTSQDSTKTLPERDEQYVGVLNDDFTAVVEVHKMYDGKLRNLGREGGREANTMFTYGGWYYYCSSALRGWNTCPTYYMAGQAPLGPFVDENEQANSTTEMKGSIGNFSHVSQVVGFTTIDTPVTPQAPLGQMVLEYGDRWCNIAGNGRGYEEFAPLSFENGKNKWPVPVYNNMSQFYFDIDKGTWKPGPNNNYLDNPAFECDRVTGLSKPAGWDVDNISGQTAQINYGGSRTSLEYNSAFDGNFAWYHGYTKRNPGTDPYKAKISQTVKNLPDGIYTLYSWVKSSGGQSDCYLYTSSGGTEYKAPVNTAIGEWTLAVTEHIVVTDGTCEVGMYSDAAADQWAQFDDMALIRSGDLPKAANTSNNTLTLDRSNVALGDTVTLTAVGDRQSANGSTIGDEKYIPTTWASTEDGKSGVFTVSGQVYQTGYTPSVAGVFTITANFQKQAWDGSSWITKNTDTKTVALQVYTPTNTAGNGLSVIPSSVVPGQTVTITAKGNRQSITPTVIGDERYLPIAWSSSEEGKSGVFTVSGQVYQANYTPSFTGVFTITATYQKQVWDGTSWVNGITDTNTATLTVSAAPTANAANNALALNVTTITAGGTVNISAVGDRQNVAGTILGEERYIPVTWTSTETGKSGVFTVSGQVYSSSYIPTLAGNYTLTAIFQKQSWDGTAWINSSTDTKTISLTVNAASTGSKSGGGTSATPTSTTNADILVNGKAESAGKVTTTQKDDKTVTTISIDQNKLEQKLSQEGNGVRVTIPVNGKSDVVVGELTGQMVKSMESKEAVLQIKTENATYTLPTAQINIDNVSKQLGTQVALQDIKVSITIAAPSADTLKEVQDNARKNNYQIVVKPVEFDITCTSGSKTVEVSKFNSYVERIISIPAGIDASKITTGIVLNADGSFSHVPTTIIAIDGKYYAKINSLTNSTYSVIYSQKTFADVNTHWAKDAVNDMGSRLVINGSGDGTFEPDRDITRAEFAAIVVKGLGLMRPGTGKDIFRDVTKNDWYFDAVSIAYEYDIIGGYGNGTFGPEDKITREQAMTMTARAMKLTGLKADFKANEVEKLLEGFKDVGNSADYVRESVASCIKTGIITGREGNMVAPESNITRAEVAVIIKRLLQKSGLIK